MPENILNTRLSKFLRIDYPILLAPMAMISGGRLAAAVTSAGGLGLIGGGYGDKEWLQREFDHATGTKVGCGFITWSLAKKPELLDQTLARQPAAIMLSFGDLHSFADRVRAAGVPLIAQVQTVDQAAQALDAGTDIIVAQGGEAGGHGMAARSSFTLVPEVADLAAERRPEALVVLAGRCGRWPRACGSAGPRCRRRPGGDQVLGELRGIGVAASTSACHPGQRRRHLSNSGL